MMINLDYLKKTTNNDKEVILQLIEIFKSQLPDLKESIIKSYNNKNWIALKNAAHKAKNSYKMMGLDKNADNLKQIELECLKTDLINCKKMVEFFLSEYTAIINELDKEIDI